MTLKTILPPLLGAALGYAMSLVSQSTGGG